MRPQIERSLKAVLLVAVTALVGVTFYVAGPALGVPFALLAGAVICYGGIALMLGVARTSR